MGSRLFDAVIFDLDGVITTTALVHGKAWKKTFDDYLHVRAKREGEPFKEFTHEKDYLCFVDGKPRYKGVQSFLESRHIHIPYGDMSDLPDQETICGLGNKKNKLFKELLDTNGAEVYQSTVDFIKILKRKGIRVGVASSSKNCRAILQSAGIENLFETRVDGEVSAAMGLKGKPEPDIFITAARNLNAKLRYTVVVEDAVSGTLAGRNGGFGLVLGIAREHNEKQLLKNGADLVIKDMADITLEHMREWFERIPLLLFPSWHALDAKRNMSWDTGRIFINPYYQRSPKKVFASKKKPAFFLDYDGTLTPIVSRPELAVLSGDMRDVVLRLSRRYLVAIVSGRKREDVESLVNVPDIFYAGSHGFDIKGPGYSLVQPKAQEAVPMIANVVEQLKHAIGSMKGVIVENKKFSVAVHYRLSDEKRLPLITEEVNRIVREIRNLRLLKGKKVFELLPKMEWHKGMAIRWIMDALHRSWATDTIVYVGDDITDEYAFRAIRTRGIGIRVGEAPKASAADFQVSSPEEVKNFFEKIISF